MFSGFSPGSYAAFSANENRGLTGGAHAAGRKPESASLDHMIRVEKASMLACPAPSIPQPMLEQSSRLGRVGGTRARISFALVMAKSAFGHGASTVVDVCVSGSSRTIQLEFIRI
jgi:hypothetical protein